jgi:hypothetical protein
MCHDTPGSGSVHPASGWSNGYIGLVTGISAMLVSW